MADKWQKTGKRGADPLGALTQSVLGPALKRRGFAVGDILAQWPQIVGARLAGATLPEKIAWPRRISENPEDAPKDMATLHLRVDGPVAIEIQHMSTQIIERLNVYFGYRAIGKLRIIQAPLPVAKREKPHPVADPADVAVVKAMVAPVSDVRLKSALTRLGQNIAAKSGSMNKP